MRLLLARLQQASRNKLAKSARYTPFQRLISYTQAAMSDSASIGSTEPVEDSTTTTTKTEPLPKLSASEFKIYNRMAEHMDYFHNNFRATWNLLYSAASSGKRPSNMSIRQFINTGEQFCHHLTMHHTIEEQHIFPVLGQRMEIFKQEMELLTQHKQIHIGLDKLEKYLEECKLGETELRMSQLKEILDSFGTVLWTHLAEEVKNLGAENMRKYWSTKEMQRMPM